MKNSTNIVKYKRLAPVYDLLFGRLLDSARKKVFTSITFKEDSKVLLMGVGTGEDIKYIPDYCCCTGIDISEPMLARARKKSKSRNLLLYNMNAEKVEFPDASFDYIILNLILSVAENPQKVVSEAIRVLKNDGKILVFDKFIKKEENISFLRRIVNKFTSFAGTDINRCFEEIIAEMPLDILKDEPVFLRGAYRKISIAKARSINMHDIITYTLRNNQENSNSFYRDLTLFTTEVLRVAESLAGQVLDSYRSHVTDNSRDKLRSREEYILELLMLGVLWQVYSGDALELEEMPCLVLTGLTEMRRNNGALKPGIDFLRGILSTLFLAPDLHDHPAVTALTVNNLKKLLDWLAATGDFAQEVKRLKLWKNFFNTLPVAEAAENLATSITLAIWFEERSTEVLGCYTPKVDSYLKKIRPRRYWKEDVIFCGRRRVEYHLNMIAAEIMNKAFRKDFLKTARKTVLLPGCLRLLAETECRSVPVELGFACSCCTNGCKVREITFLGRKYGFEVLIVPHESTISSREKDARLLEKDTGAVGVACVLNLISGGLMLKGLGIPAQCVILDYCGCKNHWHEKGIPTDINMEQLKQVLGITSSR
jgi:ubiquinone/menaquinone biosynthesis C-methylase UbiE